MAKRTLDEQEMVDILEDIARNGNNGAARIAAIKVLRDMDAGKVSSEDGFAALDAMGSPNVAPLRAKGA
jgi:hypothetical protein